MFETEIYHKYYIGKLLWLLLGSSAEPKQKWNYVTVRKDAHMFWWVYFSTAAEGFANKPLVLWLQVLS